MEERVEASSDPDRQFVWGLRYIDDIALRDRDTVGDGTLDERLYGMQDANWNATGVSLNDATVVERYVYNAYGDARVLTTCCVARIRSEYDWETRFSGYSWDFASGVYAVRHRMLSSLTSWAQRDPLGLAGGTNLYTFASSTPITNVDPDGRIDWCVFTSRSDVQCFCAIAQLVDTTIAAPLPAPYSWIPNLADCACDMVSMKSDACSGCLKEAGARWGLLVLSCGADLVGSFGSGNMFLWMVEFFSWVVTTLSAGGGFGQTGWPVALHHCEDWWGVDLTGVPPSEWPFNIRRVISS